MRQTPVSPAPSEEVFSVSWGNKDVILVEFWWEHGLFLLPVVQHNSQQHFISATSLWKKKSVGTYSVFWLYSAALCNHNVNTFDFQATESTDRPAVPPRLGQTSLPRSASVCETTPPQVWEPLYRHRWWTVLGQVPKQQQKVQKYTSLLCCHGKSDM